MEGKMASKIKCMECGKEYEVPCYMAQFHKHNRWELMATRILVKDPKRGVHTIIVKDLTSK